MEQKNLQTHKIDKKYHKDILSFVKLNEIEDVDVFINKCFKKGFDIERYGLLGIENEVKEIVKEVEVEKIVEKVVEVPVEKIVERIVEIPVDKIVEVIKEVQLPPKEIEVIKYVDREVLKEVPVEKIVEKIIQVSDDTQINEMLSKIQQLENRPPEIVEVVKEVEVDKIVEVIKEVPVEKIIEVDNSTEKLKMLQNTLQNLRKELSLKDETILKLDTKIKELESIKLSQGAVYLKGSNITENI